MGKESSGWRSMPNPFRGRLRTGIDGWVALPLFNYHTISQSAEEDRLPATKVQKTESNQDSSEKDIKTSANLRN